MRRFGFSRRLLLMFIVPLLAAGCAATEKRKASWPSLPSPWATVKQTKPRSDAETKAAVQPPPAPADKAKPAEGDGSTMAMFNDMT